MTQRKPQGAFYERAPDILLGKTAELCMLTDAQLMLAHLSL